MTQRVHCTHMDSIRNVNPSSNVCDQCIAMGDTWVNLRMCLVCGNVGCCDSSKNTHATKHFHATDHPLMKSYKPPEDGIWCYVDEVGFMPS